MWQIHPFGEGNTRTTAVFTIQYLRTFGFAMSNETFAYHSWYFRNALVRANYNNLAKGITATTEYIERFFRNLILGEENELKNRYLLVGDELQSAKEQIPKGKNCTLNCTLEETAVLQTTPYRHSKDYCQAYRKIRRHHKDYYSKSGRKRTYRT